MTVMEVQALLIRAVVPAIVTCYELSYGIPGEISARGRRGGLSDPVMQVAVRADHGTPYDVVEQAQQAIIRSVYTGQLIVGEHVAAAYLLPFTTTSTTTATVTTTPRVLERAGSERSTMSIVIGVALAAVLVISLCIGIVWKAKHKPLGQVSSHTDVRAKHPTQEKYEVAEVPRSLHYFPTDDDVGQYKVPEFYAKPMDMKYGLAADQPPSDDALGMLMSSMWDTAGKRYGIPAGGGLLGGGRLTPGMVPDPTNAAYSTAYDEHYWGPWDGGGGGGGLASGGGGLNKYSTVAGSVGAAKGLGAFQRSPASNDDEYLTMMDASQAADLPGGSPSSPQLQGAAFLNASSHYYPAGYRFDTKM